MPYNHEWIFKDNLGNNFESLTSILRSHFFDFWISSSIRSSISAKLSVKSPWISALYGWDYFPARKGTITDDSYLLK